MSATAAPKYSRREFERRWLAADDALPAAASGHATITDRYLDGSRLRLRRVVAADGETTFKLCRKYGDRPGAESITNLYLTAAEFTMLNVLPGTVVQKQRYTLSEGSVDRYTGKGTVLLVFEREFADAGAAAAFVPPPFTRREITHDPAFSGASLARRFGEATAAPSLQVLSGTWSVHSLPPEAPLPEGLPAEPWFALLRSTAELSVVCRSDFIITGSRREDGWACLVVDGPLDFALTGIIAGISSALARAAVPVFVTSSYDTDYVLVPQRCLQAAIAALTEAGMSVRRQERS